MNNYYFKLLESKLEESDPSFWSDLIGVHTSWGLDRLKNIGNFWANHGHIAGPAAAAALAAKSQRVRAAAGKGFNKLKGMLGGKPKTPDPQQPQPPS